MSITTDEIKNIADLSMLEFDDDSLHKITEEMQKIVEFASKINSFLTTDCDSNFDSETEKSDFERFRNSMRSDEVKNSVSRELIFEDAKNHKNGFFYLKNNILNS